MERSNSHTNTISGRPSSSSKPSCRITHTHNSDCSSNPSFDKYNPCDVDERAARNFADRFLVAACESGHTSWDSDPESMANFLKEINKEYSLNVTINMDEIKKELSVLDNRIKKRSPLHQSDHNKPSNKTNNESPSTTQTLDNMVVVKDETNVEVNMDEAIVNGEESLFVIRRVLNATDIDYSQCRFSMPCNQVRNLNEFLKSEEVAKLSQKTGVPAKVIDSNNRIYETNLRKVQAGSKTHSYAIGKPWNQIKMDNGFVVGMVVEVRVRRGNGGEPCFIIERVERREINCIPTSKDSSKLSFDRK